MGLFGRKKDLSGIPVSNLKAKDRKMHTGELESDRDASIYQIEDILIDIADAGGKRSLARRKKRSFRKNI